MNFKFFLACSAAIFLTACGAGYTDVEQAGFVEGENAAAQDVPRLLIGLNGDTLEVVDKSNEDWAAELSQEEYYILREAGTERAFTSELLKEKRSGMFVCAACQLPLFSSETKFRSGTGWPSFYEPVRADHIVEHADRSYGMVRTEVRCGRCDGHQGHVFNDGPEPTGLRYCINGDALDFVPNP